MMKRPTDIKALEKYVNDLCKSHGLDPLRYWGDTLMDLEHRGYAFDSRAIFKAMANKLEKMAEETGEEKNE